MDKRHDPHKRSLPPWWMLEWLTSEEVVMPFVDEADWAIPEDDECIEGLKHEIETCGSIAEGQNIGSNWRSCGDDGPTFLDKDTPPISAPAYRLEGPKPKPKLRRKRKKRVKKYVLKLVPVWEEVDELD